MIQGKLLEEELPASGNAFVMKPCLALSLSAVLLLCMPTGASAQVVKSTPTTAKTITSQDLEALGLNLEHQTLAQMPGSTGSQWSLGGSIYFPVFQPHWGLDINGGFYSITGAGNTVNGSRLQVSLETRWSQQLGGILTPAGRGGLSVGFQNNAISGVNTMATWNYGTFADLYPTPSFTISAKAGFVSKCAASNGYYLGGGANYYATPDFSLKGSIDYSHFSAFGGSSETDYGLRAEYLLSPKAPISLYGGYTYNAFAPATNFHINTTTFGLNFYGGGSGTSLNDRQRSGTLDNSTLYLGVQCRF